MWLSTQTYSTLLHNAPHLQTINISSIHFGADAAEAPEEAGKWNMSYFSLSSCTEVKKKPPHSLYFKQDSSSPFRATCVSFLALWTQLKHDSCPACTWSVCLIHCFNHKNNLSESVTHSGLTEDSSSPVKHNHPPDGVLTAPCLNQWCPLVAGSGNILE